MEYEILEKLYFWGWTKYFLYNSTLHLSSFKEYQDNCSEYQAYQNMIFFIY